METKDQVRHLICLAQLAEQTERYEDMVYYAREATRSEGQELSLELLNLVANAHKCKIGSRRTAWRAVSALQCKETNTKSKSSLTIQGFKDTVEGQIREICQEALSFVGQWINSDFHELKCRLELYKIRGDYHRYLCQIAREEEFSKFEKEAEASYQRGLQLIDEANIRDGMKMDPIKLSLCLNLSVFYYEIKNMTEKAIATCEKSFNEALQLISDLEDNRFTDLVTIMQLMHDNITAWKAERDSKAD